MESRWDGFEERHELVGPVRLLFSLTEMIEIARVLDELPLVRFAELSGPDLEAYVESGEPTDKAGAYAIQGRAAAFVTELHGSYSGIMGLPLYETAQLIRKF